MKKKEKTLTRHILNWILIYLLVLIGSIILTIILTYAYNNNTIAIGQFDKKYYTENNGEFNPNVPLHKAKNIVFDADGNQIAFYPAYEQTNDWDKYAQKLLPDLADEEYIYKIGVNPSAEIKFAVYVAMPTDDGGVFFFFKQPPFFNKMIIILIIVISALIILMAVYTWLLYQLNQRNLIMQRNYVDNITHELKSPISSVKALTETMYDGLIQDEEKRKRYYKIILNEMTGLENTVSNMLELSKIQNNQIDCSKMPLSIYETFGSIIEKYAALCDERGMDFYIDSDYLSGYSVYTNQSLASRLMDILLDNALKFAGRNGEKGSIRIECENKAKELVFTIKDNGTGISSDDQKLIFSRFYKGDKSHNEKGSGLGLSIAQEIAYSLGEKLWLKSSGPAGTAFSFTIQKN